VVFIPIKFEIIVTGLYKTCELIEICLSNLKMTLFWVIKVISYVLYNCIVLALFWYKTK